MTRTAPPAGSTRTCQAAPRQAGRPGTSRCTRDRASNRSSCRTSSRTRPRNSWLRSMNRSRGGGATAPIAFGEIHRNGGSTRTATRTPPRPASGLLVSSAAAICRAACRPDSAATSAV